ncbi:TPA: ParA family protein [Klebsiella oxytoca]|nr:ParA family protein [Klebsiella oxytoca]
MEFVRNNITKSLLPAFRRPYLIAVTNSKGGPGKSTLSANLAGLCADAGLRTLGIDIETQPTYSCYYPLEHEATGGIMELLTTTAGPDNDTIISRTTHPMLDLIKSNDPLDQLRTLLQIAPDGRLRLFQQLHRFCDYDVIIADTQGAVSALPEVATMAADTVFCPTVPKMPDAREFFRGTFGMFHGLNNLFSMFGRPFPRVVVGINRMGRTNIDINALPEIVAAVEGGFPGITFPVEMLPFQVWELTAYQQAHALGMAVHRIEPRDIRDRVQHGAGQVILDLARHLLPGFSAQLDEFAQVLQSAPGPRISDARRQQWWKAHENSLVSALPGRATQ